MSDCARSDREILDDVLRAVEAMAKGYELLRQTPSNLEVAADFRVLLEVAEDPSIPSIKAVERDRATRRAKFVVAQVDCPRCGRQRGQRCRVMTPSLDQESRNRDAVFPHREREQAERAVRMSA